MRIDLLVIECTSHRIDRSSPHELTAGPWVVGSPTTPPSPLSSNKVDPMSVSEDNGIDAFDSSLFLNLKYAPFQTRNASVSIDKH